MIRRRMLITGVVAALALTTIVHGTVDAMATPDHHLAIGGTSRLATVSTHGTPVRSTVADTVDLGLRLISRTGRFESGRAVAVNNETGESFRFGEFDATGTATVQVPHGRYDVNAIEISADPANTVQPKEATLLSRTGVRITAATTVTLDATKGKPVTTTVDKILTNRAFGEIGLMSANPKGDAGGTVSLFTHPEFQIFAVPGGKVTDHTYAFFLRASLAVKGDADPTYHLAFLERGAIPADLSYSTRQRELAAVNADYQGQGTASALAQRGEHADFGLPGTGEQIMRVFDLKLPAKRTEYYSGGLRWDHTQLVSTEDSEEGQVTWSHRTYQAGWKYQANWNPAPVGPAFNSVGGGVVSDGKNLDVALALFSGSDRHQYTSRWEGGMSGTLTLSRDGKEIGRSDTPDAGRFPIPDGRGVYTLHAVAERSVPWTVVGSKVDVKWTFRDAAAGQVPVFVVRTSGEKGRLTLSPQSQTGRPELAAIGVDVSFDDGATWQVAPVTGDHATIKHPPTGGFVSLRVFARDTTGNTVTQTVLRAYQIC